MAKQTQSIFITGTDTNVGKTYFTTGVLKALRKTGIDAVGFKPIECGVERSDAYSLLEASGANYSIEQINPVWFKQPVAPMVAAEISGHKIDFDIITSAYKKLSLAHDVVLVEGAGGWFCPLNAKKTIADLAIALNCQTVVVVAANRLGVINHSLLTCRTIDLPNRNLVLNHFANEDEETDISRATNFESLKKCLPDWNVLEIATQEDCDSIWDKLIT